MGATLGCALAAREEGKDRRVVLFVGDGSLQLVRDTVSHRALASDLPLDLARDRDHDKERVAPVYLCSEQ